MGVRICNDNYSYCKLIQLLGRRECLLQAVQEAEDAEEGAEAPELIKKMEEILMDSTKSQSIQDAARKSVGMEISDIDLINVEHFSKQVVELVEYRKELTEYLRSKMKAVAPNLAALIGDVVGARLISHAGSLTNLAKYPASTVQILGAEKALFRALKTKGNTPKYGLIFHSTFIGRAAAKNKGRISRYLANKCSIACRIDNFSEEPTNKFGEKLREQVEERLRLYDTGEAPRKNVDCMKEVMDELRSQAPAKDGKKDKKAKKAAKEDAAGEVDDEAAKKAAKKEKKAKKEAAEASAGKKRPADDGEESKPKKKKKEKA